MKPQISVLLPIYNEANYIRQCLESILNQEGVTFEICVSDNASDDHTWDILNEYGCRHANIIKIRQKNKIHPYDNLLEALNIASGEYVFLMGGDDYLLPCAFSSAMTAFSKFPEISGFHYKMLFFRDRDNSPIVTLPPIDLEDKINQSQKCFLQLMTQHINRDELIIGVFRREDFNVIARIMKPTCIEAIGTWLFIGISLYRNKCGPFIKISEKPYLMKRHDKIANASSWDKSAKAHFKKSRLIDVFINFLQLKIISGSISNICSLYKLGLIEFTELAHLILASRHDDQGFCYYGPLLYPFYRIRRFYKRCLNLPGR